MEVNLIDKCEYHISYKITHTSTNLFDFINKLKEKKVNWIFTNSIESGKILIRFVKEESVFLTKVNAEDITKKNELHIEFSKESCIHSMGLSRALSHIETNLYDVNIYGSEKTYQVCTTYDLLNNNLIDVRLVGEAETLPDHIKEDIKNQFKI